MEELMALFGCEDVRDLASVLGYSERDQERKVYSWHAGDNRPSYDALMQIVKKVGQTPAGQASVLPQAEVAGAASSADPLAALATAVEALAEANIQYGERLREVEQKLDAVPPAQLRAPAGTKRRAAGRSS